MVSRISAFHRSDRAAGGAVRPLILCVAVLLLFGVLALGLARLKKQRAATQESLEQSTETAAQTRESTTPPPDDTPVLITNQTASTPPPVAGSVQLSRTRQPTQEVAPALRPQPSAYTQQLVNNLVDLKAAGIPRTAEQVAAWKQNLQTLVQQGAAAVPAIQQFLEKNEDFVFGADGARSLGYDSARRAMFDALAQIGGPEAIGALAGTLQSTADPREIAMLARSLDQLAPEQYRQQAADAARQVLAMMADGKAGQPEVAPLFEVLGKYGGAGAAAEIEQASAKWKYYSAIALADMPDGAGIPSLIRQVEDSGGGPVKNIAALEMLAQNAVQSQDARAALVQQVRANNLSPNSWAYLTQILAGDQVHFGDSAYGSAIPPATTPDLRTFHIASGNQNFYTAPPPGGFTADQSSQQLALIDELLAATSNPAAVQALQNSRSIVLRRSGQNPAAGFPHP